MKKIFGVVIIMVLVATTAYAVTSKDKWNFEGPVNISGNMTAADVNYGDKETVSSDAYTATLSPAPDAYTEGMVVVFQAYTANVGAATLNVNGLGAKSIKILNDQDPGNACLEADGLYQVGYDGTSFQLLQPCAN